MREARGVGNPATAGNPAADGLAVTRLTERPDDLGESPVWDADRQCLWWIDGVAGLVRRLDLGTGGRCAPLDLAVGGHIGAIALAGNGDLLIAREHVFLLCDPVTGGTTTLMELAGASPDMRFNDGKPDRRGRFVCAGMGRRGDPLGALHRIDGDLRHDVLATDLRIGNGVCFSPAGETLYFSDTPARKLYACDYDPATGTASQPRLHIDTGPLSSGIDGATVDSDGNLWAALISSGEIACFDPAGTLRRRFAAPVDLPSSLAFGGETLQRLFITSIRDSGTGRAVSRHPEGGHLFAIDGIGATGLAEARFNLSATP